MIDPEPPAEPRTPSWLSKLAGKIANEPVVALTATVGGGITWLFGHFSFLPAISDTTRSTITTIVVVLVGLVARQFVTPTGKGRRGE